MKLVKHHLTARCGRNRLTFVSESSALSKVVRSLEPERVAMQSLLIVPAALLSLLFVTARSADEQEVKFSDCPAAVRKTLQAEAKGAKIETVTKEKDDDDQMVYWAEAKVDGRLYAIGVLENGTLTEMNLAVDDDELTFADCPAAVQATFRGEAFGEKVDAVGKDMKYGVMIYETVVEHKGKSYEIVVAEDGTLVEKVLVIKDEEVALDQCPTAVKASLHEHAKRGSIGPITRSTGIGRHTFEAEVKIGGSVYLLEIAENGHLISKSLEAAEE